MKINERVGAINGTSDEGKVLSIFGFGVYLGDKVPDKEVGGFMGEELRKQKIENPTIKLDNGNITYGCECWWGSEDSIKKQIEVYKKEGYTVKEVLIANVRKENLKDTNDELSKESS